MHKKVFGLRLGEGSWVLHRGALEMSCLMMTRVDLLSCLLTTFFQ